MKAPISYNAVMGNSQVRFAYPQVRYPYPFIYIPGGFTERGSREQVLQVHAGRNWSRSCWRTRGIGWAGTSVAPIPATLKNTGLSGWSGFKRCLKAHNGGGCSGGIFDTPSETARKPHKTPADRVQNGAVGLFYPTLRAITGYFVRSYPTLAHLLDPSKWGDLARKWAGLLHNWLRSGLNVPRLQGISHITLACNHAGRAA